MVFQAELPQIRLQYLPSERVYSFPPAMSVTKFHTHTKQYPDL